VVSSPALSREIDEADVNEVQVGLGAGEILGPAAHQQERGGEGGRETLTRVWTMSWTCSWETPAGTVSLSPRVWRKNPAKSSKVMNLREGCSQQTGGREGGGEDREEEPSSSRREALM
jgi:hypothetical protein